MNTMTSITYGFKLNAIHKLNLNENIEPLHGHEYNYYVTLMGEIDPVTGYLWSSQNVRAVIQDYITKKYHKKNLNDLMPFSSGEMLAKRIYDELKQSPISGPLLKIAIQETTKNRFEYPCLMKK